MADFPAGTGLGSSESFTTALLKALHVQMRNLVHPSDLAEQACKIEMDILKEPVGKQDQYIAALGGITCFRFLPNGQVDACSRCELSARRTLYELGGSSTTACSLPAVPAPAGRDPQGAGLQRASSSDSGMIANLHFTKQLGREVGGQALELE